MTEGLVREVFEETGIEIVELARLAFVLQVDSRRPPRFRRSSGREIGYLATIFTFEVESWRGEVRTQDPDGVVLRASFVPRAEAIARLDAVWWHGVTARYLRGDLAQGSVVLQRWHADGSVEEAGRVAPGPAPTTL